MVAGTPPTLAELDADVTASRRVYEVGYTIGEFVVARGGQAALVRLVQANGDTAAVLGLSPAGLRGRVVRLRPGALSPVAVAQGAATTMRSRERTTKARSSWATTARVIASPPATGSSSPRSATRSTLSRPHE